MPAAADIVGFRLFMQGEERNITAQTFDIEGVSYVSLQVVMEQAGGAFNDLPGRVRVDLHGTTAWLTPGDVRVHALSIFSLQHPIVKREEDALIAVDDVRQFFRTSFRGAQIAMSTPAKDVEAAPDPGLDPAGAPAPDPDAIAGRQPMSVENRVRMIVIDPGHGGYDIGLMGEGGLEEKTLALDVALRVQGLLTRTVSQNVLLTRETDLGLTTVQRALMASNSQADLLISIHAGGMISGAQRGVAIFYRSAETGAGSGLFSTQQSTLQSGPERHSRELAHALGSSISLAASVPLRGVQAAPVRLFERASMPSVMVEVGCLTNVSEAALLAEEEHRQLLAEGIVEGIVSFLSSPGRFQRAARDDRPQLVEQDL